MRTGVRLDDGGRQDANQVVRAQHIEMMDAVAEPVLVAVDLGIGLDFEVKRAATLVVVADRLHAHLGDGFVHRLSVGKSAFRAGLRGSWLRPFNYSC